MDSMESKFECSICDWCGDDMHGHLMEKHPERLIVHPICPSCIERATYQTPDGTFWCANGHYWRNSGGLANG